MIYDLEIVTHFYFFLACDALEFENDFDDALKLGIDFYDV